MLLGVEEQDIRLELVDPAASAGAGEIVFSHALGVIALRGTVAIKGDGAVFTVAETQKLEQRRGAFRLSVACPVHVVRAGGVRLDYRTADLSLTGMRILDADELSGGVEFFDVPRAADTPLDEAAILSPEDKPVLAERFCAQHGLDLAEAVAYGDSMSDVFLFEAVGVRISVNGDHHLAERSDVAVTGTDLLVAYRAARELLDG